MTMSMEREEEIKHEIRCTLIDHLNFYEADHAADLLFTTLWEYFKEDD